MRLKLAILGARSSAASASSCTSASRRSRTTWARSRRELGNRHVHVHCQSFASNLVDVSARGRQRPVRRVGDPVGHDRPQAPDLQRARALPARRAQRRATAACCTNADCPQKIWEDVLAVHTLAHEVWHLHGIGTKRRTECYALQTTARAASSSARIPPLRRRPPTYAYVRFYPNCPDEYRQARCGNGGPLDLRPADPHWP